MGDRHIWAQSFTFSIEVLRQDKQTEFSHLADTLMEYCYINLSPLGTNLVFSLNQNNFKIF